ncbi:Respiratory supercomplex factor 1, mitochondrial [Coemansia sp. RSA 1813]|nr:Respiratory supercomplex factor 1, mitochondrial [Coemansia sp. RSA 1646]KAJ1772047.1 Respiratory supercomplex factor 1, mitochondrial [Coemansia sp. RSA 1843]KAJ2090588.1 Respiratory supercomplex factor 1, mitochondrial [Coemansia sp. RSA 986]KAJ2216326.1 Respiratory supercomplex factor 1, mitochondrial [Coemansia sp. RSA 487]KAJ2570889.1 Respiratory supercomplex factor 1, mitochondrial [Coemansia sp. RSA 1813]
MSGGAKSVSARFKEEPLIPLGVAATVGAFLFASWGLYQGNAKNMQWGMRGRVVMQGLTVGALAWYGLYASSNSTAKERREDVRQIDWDKIEKEALAAEEASKKLAEAKKNTPLSVFAKEAEPKK